MSTSIPEDLLARIEALPVWRGPIAPRELSGGLSNRSFTVEDRDGVFVVRLGQDLPCHHVFREREIMATRAAHAAGFAPELVYAEPGIMVSRFIHAETYDAQRMRASIERVAAMIRRFHQDMPAQICGPGFMFWPFHVIRDYAHTLRRSDSPWRDRLDGYVELARELEAVQSPLPIVYGHHDLLPANVLDDGSRLWLIDYEYAGFSTAMFDLAGIASNAGYSDEESLALLTCYFEAEPQPHLLHSHAAMQCASLLREAMWSMVSNEFMDTPGVDYVAYANDNLEALESTLDRYRSRYG